MARNTPKQYRNQVLYSIFTRNYSSEGNFPAITRDLDRIQALGVDIIWLMPIHPLGIQNRKGSVGSPYAISDYRAIDPANGTEAQLRELVEQAHRRDMKVIIDVVYNHTSPDSWLAEHHPEWFYHKPDGSFGNRVGDWTDIIDLDYSQQELWDYQIETLKRWAEIVDGFRCDVAPLIPLEFWLRARREVEQVRPGCIWLAESVEHSFIRYLRSQGVDCLSDGEIFQAFDISYDYDVYPVYKQYVMGQKPLESYADALTLQQSIYPDNYVKLHFLENHDRCRAAQDLPDGKMRRNWTAFTYFQQGMTMLYAGQEVSSAHRPLLFEKDPVDWTAGEDISGFLRTLYDIKQDPIFAQGVYSLKALPRDVILAEYTSADRRLIGIFSLRGESSVVPVDLPEGVYENLLGGTADVFEGCLGISGEPVILRV